jgi:hypothetical protein
MIVTDVYLRADSQQAIDKALVAAGLNDPRISAVDYIGNIEAVEGYHANLRVLRALTAKETKALAAIVIAAPASPVRVWA